MKSNLRAKFSSRALSLLVIIALMSFGVSATFASDSGNEFQNVVMQGSGTIEVPYVVDSCEKLQAIDEQPAASYLFSTNIDCSTSADLNGGSGFKPIANFTGRLDGRLHSINNLNISADQENVGLFETIGENSTVQNIYFDNVNITNTKDGDDTSVHSGILSGTNAGTALNISIGTSTLVSQGAVGGLVGLNTGSIDRANIWGLTINQQGTYSTTLGGISAISSGSIADSKVNVSYSNMNLPSTCGGIVGHLDNGTIENSYALGQMECQSQPGGSVGGLVGIVSGAGASITNSFASIVANHANYFDGTIVGKNDSGTSLSSTYYNMTDNGSRPCDNSGDTSCTGQWWEYFAGGQNAPINTFDFESKWYFYENSDLPDPKWSWTLTPLSPVTVTGSLVNDSIALSWSVPQNDTGMDFTGYQVAYTTDGGQTFGTIDTVETQAAIENVDPHLNYEIRVRARNVNGLGLPTYPLNYRAIPSVVSTPSVSQTYTRAIELSWDDVSTEANSYVVQYKKSDTETWMTFSKTDYPTPTALVYPLDESTSYDFRVGSINERGASDFSAVTSASTTQLNNYNVSSCSDLQNISQDPFGSYTLTGDIDCTSSSSWNNGEGFIPLGGVKQGQPFSGELHGAGYTISNLYMNRPGTIAGLFFAIDGATIDNLTLNGGQIAGSRANDGTVYTDSVTNPIVGALSAFAGNSVVDNVHSNIDFPSTAVGGLNGGVGGLIGMVMPSSFGLGSPATSMTISNSSTSGDIDGIVSGGLVGGSLLVDLFSILTAEDGVTSAAQATPYLGSSLSLTINNSQTTGELNCTIVCGGIVGISAGDLTLDNVTRSGITGEIGANNPPIGPGFDDIMAMLALSGPVTGGLVGGSLPASLDGSTASFKVLNSTVSGSILGTLASSVVGLSLPAVSLDASILAQEIPEDQLAGAITQIVLSTISNVLSTDALRVENTTLSANITCTVACAGVTTLSLGKTLLNNVLMSGNIVNDNGPLINAGHPISFCPIQITGGLVGAQLLFPLDITNSSASGNINVVQAGDAPQTQAIDLLSADFDQEGVLLGLFCSLGSLLQGTGGIVGSFISPLQISGIAEAILQLPANTLNKMDMLIDNTHNTGKVTSNAQSATGGLAGLIFGKSLVNNSSASGEVSNSTFGEMFRTPIASASTGGLIGSSLGGYEASGNLVDLIMYFIETSSAGGTFEPESMAEVFSQMSVASGYSEIVGSHASGNVLSSNSAGGLIGNVGGITKIQKSYALGNVYGVAAGGLIGSGFNMGSPLGILNIFSSIELQNTYARGNVYASADPDTVTFAGGLIGMMAHLGELKIDRSYSTGAVGVNGGATNTRLVAGGLVGAELDMSIAPVALLTAFGSDTNVLPFVLGNLEALNLKLESGVSITNSFTTSSVPAHSSGADYLIKEIGQGNPSDYKTTGSIFGFLFSLDTENFPTFPTADENGNIEDTELANFISQIKWRSTDEVVSNSYYDKTANNASKCAYGVPTFSEFFFDILANSHDTENPMSPEDIMIMFPKLKADAGNTCTAVNTNGAAPTYFKNNKSVAPFDTWDFNGVWFAHGNDYPTFTDDPTDPVVPPTEDPGNTTPTTTTKPTTTPSGPTVTPNPGGNGPFVPTDIPDKDDVDTVTETITDNIPDDLTEVLPNVIEKIDAEVTGKAQDELKPDDKGILGSILGVMSATGAFLLRHLLEAVLVILLGAGLTFLAKKKKIQDSLRKPPLT